VSRDIYWVPEVQTQPHYYSSTQNDGQFYYQFSLHTTQSLKLIIKLTSGYATWFTARGAIRIAHSDVIDDVITRKL